MSTNLEVMNTEISQKMSSSQVFASQVELLRKLLIQMLAKHYLGKQLYTELVEIRGYELKTLRSALKQLNPATANLTDIDLALLQVKLEQMIAQGSRGKELYAELVEKLGYELKAVRSALQQLNPANLNEIEQELNEISHAVLLDLIKQLLEKRYTGKQLKAELVERRGYEFTAVQLALRELNPAPASIAAKGSPERKSKENEEARKNKEIEDARRNDQLKILNLANKPPLYPDHEVKIKGEDIKVKADKTSLAQTAVVGLQTAPLSTTPTSGDKISQSPPQLPVATTDSSLVEKATKMLSIFSWGFYGSSAAQNTALDPKNSSFGSNSPLRVSQGPTPIDSPRLNPNSQSGPVTFQFPILLDKYARGSSTGTSNSSGTNTPTLVDFDKEGEVIFTDGKDKRKNSKAKIS